MSKRKAYRPKAVMLNPLALLRPADKPARDRVMGRFLTALEAMARGKHPGRAEWQDLSDMLNTVETLTVAQHKLIPAEVMPTVNRAIAGMVNAAERFKAGHGMRLDAAGFAALRDVLTIYDLCLAELTEREMAMAQAETQRRVREAVRNLGPHDVVVAL